MRRPVCMKTENRKQGRARVMWGWGWRRRGNTTFSTIRSHGTEAWRTSVVCNLITHLPANTPSLSEWNQVSVWVFMYALACVCSSPRSILRMRGLHCLWPLQPRSSMSWMCIWFRMCRSSVFTALINYKHTNTTQYNWECTFRQICNFLYQTLLHLTATVGLNTHTWKWSGKRWSF